MARKSLGFRRLWLDGNEIKQVSNSRNMQDSTSETHLVGGDAVWRMEQNRRYNQRADCYQQFWSDLVTLTLGILVDSSLCAAWLNL